MIIIFEDKSDFFMRDNAIVLVSFYVYFSQTIAHNTRRHVKPTLRLFSFGGAILIITPHDIHSRQFPLWLCTRSSRSIGIRYDYPAASSLFVWCVKIEKVLLRSFAVVTKKLFFISLERDSGYHISLENQYFRYYSYYYHRKLINCRGKLIYSFHLVDDVSSLPHILLLP